MIFISTFSQDFIFSRKLESTVLVAFCLISSLILDTCFCASFSLSKTSNILQLSGTHSNHITCTGLHQLTSFTIFQVQSFIIFILPYTSYDTTVSFLCNVQVIGSKVDIIHILASFEASRTTQTAGAFGLYLSSSISACKFIISRNSLIHSQVIAESSTKDV